MGEGEGDGEGKNTSLVKEDGNVAKEIESDMEPQGSEAIAGHSTVSASNVEVNVEGRAGHLEGSEPAVRDHTDLVNRYPALSVSEKDWDDDEYYVPERDGRRRRKRRDVSSTEELAQGGDGQTVAIIARENWDSTAADQAQPRVRAISHPDAENSGEDDEQEDLEFGSDDDEDYEEDETVSGSGSDVSSEEDDLFSDDEEDILFSDNDEGWEEGVNDEHGSPNLSHGISVRVEREEDRADFVEPLHVNAKVIHAGSGDWEDEEEFEDDDEEEEDDLDDFLAESYQFAVHHEIPRAAPTADYGDDNDDSFHWQSLSTAPLSAEQQQHLEEARSTLRASQVLCAQLEAERDSARSRASALEAMTLRLSEELHAKRRQLTGAAEVARLAEVGMVTSSSSATISALTVGGEANELQRFQQEFELRNELQRLQQDISGMKVTLERERYGAMEGDTHRSAQVPAGQTADEVQQKKMEGMKGGDDNSLPSKGVISSESSSVPQTEAGMESSALLANLKSQLDQQQSARVHAAKAAKKAQQDLQLLKQELESTRAMLISEGKAKQDLEKEVHQLRHQVVSSKQDVESVTEQRDTNLQTTDSSPGSTLLSDTKGPKSSANDKSTNVKRAPKHHVGSSVVSQNNEATDGELESVKRELKLLKAFLRDAVAEFCFIAGESAEQKQEVLQHEGGEQLVNMLITEIKVFQEHLKVIEKASYINDSELKESTPLPDADYLKSMEQEAERLRLLARATALELETERLGLDDHETGAENSLLSPGSEAARSLVDESAVGSVKSLVQKYEKSTKLTKLEIEQWNMRERAARTQAHKLAIRKQLVGRLAMGNADVARPLVDNRSEEERRIERSNFEKNSAVFDRNVSVASLRENRKMISPQVRRKADRLLDDAQAGIDGQSDVPTKVSAIQRKLDLMTKRYADSQPPDGGIDDNQSEPQIVPSTDTGDYAAPSLSNLVNELEIKAIPVPSDTSGSRLRALPDQHMWTKLASLQQDLLNVKARAAELASGLKKACDLSELAVVETEKKPSLPQSRPLYTKQFVPATLDKSLAHRTDQQLAGKLKEAYRMKGPRGV